MPAAIRSYPVMTMVGKVIVETEGYIWHLMRPIVLKVSPLILRHAIYEPAGKLVPRSAGKVLAKLI